MLAAMAVSAVAALSVAIMVGAQSEADFAEAVVGSAGAAFTAPAGSAGAVFTAAVVSVAVFTAGEAGGKPAMNSKNRILNHRLQGPNTQRGLSRKRLS